jgi:hypothetical protein
MRGSVGGTARGCGKMASTRSGVGLACECPDWQIPESRPQCEISECGSSLPLFPPLTRQRSAVCRDKSQQGKAATSRRTPKPKLRAHALRKFPSPQGRGGTARRGVRGFFPAPLLPRWLALSSSSTKLPITKQGSAGGTARGCVKMASTRSGVGLACGYPDWQIPESRPQCEISECGSSLPLFPPLTRQRSAVRRDKSQQGKAATSRRTPKPKLHASSAFLRGFSPLAGTGT